MVTDGVATSVGIEEFWNKLRDCDNFKFIRNLRKSFINISCIMSCRIALRKNILRDDSMKKLYIILGIVSILLLSGCLDNTKTTNVNVGENDSVDIDHTANNSTDINSSASGNTYPVGSNITEDGREVYS